MARNDSIEFCLAVARARVLVRVNDLPYLRGHAQVVLRTFVCVSLGRRDVFVMFRCQVAMQQSDRRNVLQAMVAICRIVERPLFIDDANRGFMRMNPYFFYGLYALDDLCVQLYGRFGSGLSVELGRVSDFEQDVLHNVAR